jgi:thioredoxin reductase (NADPH)
MLKMTEKIDVAIIGGGVGGLSAAMYARRFDLEVTIFDPFIGGTITKTDRVENYPGFIKLTGQELADKIKDHAMTYKPKIINEYVEKIEKTKDGFVLICEGKKYNTKTVILATGTEWKKLNVTGEKEYENKGVHYCALCDGYFYNGKTVAMIGAGDSAAKEALVLAGIAKKVYVIVRGDNIHPEPINYKRVLETKNIEIIKKTRVLEIFGEKKVTKIKLDNPYRSSKELELDAVFIDIGHSPISNIAKQLKAKINEKGEVVTDKLTQTNIPGFYAIGDVGDTPFKQAITAASEGSIAAYSAYEFITKKELM